MPLLRDPGDRDRRRARRPTARCSCSMTCSASTTDTAPLRPSATRTSGRDGRRRRRVRRRRPRARGIPAPEHCYSIDDDELRRFRGRSGRASARTRRQATAAREYHRVDATARPGVRSAGPGLLRAVRGGRAEHPARRRPARPAADRLSRTASTSPATSSTASTRATGSRTTSSTASTTRSSRRSTARTSSRWPRRSTTSSTTPRRSPTTSGCTRSRRRWTRRSGSPRCSSAARRDRRGDPALRGFRDISAYTVEVNRLENEGDRITREAIASLFDGGIDPMVVIRWKDLFERLEAAIDATEHAAQHPRGHRDQELVGRRVSFVTSLSPCSLPAVERDGAGRSRLSVADVSVSFGGITALEASRSRSRRARCSGSSAPTAPARRRCST